MPLRLLQGVWYRKAYERSAHSKCDFFYFTYWQDAKIGGEMVAKGLTEVKDLVDQKAKQTNEALKTVRALGCGAIVYPF